MVTRGIERSGPSLLITDMISPIRIDRRSPPVQETKTDVKAPALGSTILWNNGRGWSDHGVEAQFVGLTKEEAERINAGPPDEKEVWADIALFDSRQHSARGATRAMIESARWNGDWLTIRITKPGGATVTYELNPTNQTTRLYKVKNLAELTSLVVLHPDCTRIPEPA